MSKHLSTAGLVLTLILGALNVRADETFPTITVGTDVYTNVVVQHFTATDIYFQHSGGMSNAKLKDLAPELQKHFDFDATNSAVAERQQTQANALYQQQLQAAKKPGRSTANARSQRTEPAQKTPAEIPDIVPASISAKSVRGQKPPRIIVEQWLTAKPDITGKFVLVDFWATWCGPCRQSIPHLNGLQAKFQDQLVVIGLSDETPEEIAKMKSPKIEYSAGVDTQSRTSSALEIRGIPHAILIDPQGIVRFEGHPSYLTEKGLQNLLTKYAN